MWPSLTPQEIIYVQRPKYYVLFVQPSAEKSRVRAMAELNIQPLMTHAGKVQHFA